MGTATIDIMIDAATSDADVGVALDETGGDMLRVTLTAAIDIADGGTAML